jgi:hypothetical protein
LFPCVLVVANQFSLILGESDLRIFSAFEEKLGAVLGCGLRVKKGEWYDSEMFESFAENLRKIRDFEDLGMMSSG